MRTGCAFLLCSFSYNANIAKKQPTSVFTSDSCLFSVLRLFVFNTFLHIFLFFLQIFLSLKCWYKLDNTKYSSIQVAFISVVVTLVKQICYVFEKRGPYLIREISWTIMFSKSQCIDEAFEILSFFNEDKESTLKIRFVLRVRYKR